MKQFLLWEGHAVYQGVLLSAFLMVGTTSFAPHGTFFSFFLFFPLV